MGPDQPADKESFFYQTPFSVRPITEADKARWVELGRGMELALPDLNPFVPDDFSLVTVGGQGLPRKVADERGLAVWHAQSELRREPRAILMTRLQSANIASTLEQKAMQGVLLELWDQKQAGLRYQAQEAGLDLSVSGDEGLVIRIDGFSQHQADLLPRVLSLLDQPVSHLDFEQAKAEQLRALANKKQGVFGQAMSVIQTLVTVPSWDDEAVGETTRHATMEGFRQYLHAMRRDLRVTMFGFGNVAPNDMLAMALSVRPYVGPEAGQQPIARRILPRPGVVADYQKDSVLEDSALVELFLDPEPGPRSKAHVLLLEGLLSIRFYSQLRTVEQLGYVATTLPVMFAHCAGIGFGVQSPVQGTAGLADRFDSFISEPLPRCARSLPRNSRECAKGFWPPCKRPQTRWTRSSVGWKQICAWVTPHSMGGTGSFRPWKRPALPRWCVGMRHWLPVPGDAGPRSGSGHAFCEFWLGEKVGSRADPGFGCIPPVDGGAEVPGVVDREAHDYPSAARRFSHIALSACAERAMWLCLSQFRKSGGRTVQRHPGADGTF